MSVRVEPGDTVLQRTPRGASSRPRHLVNMTAAAFDAAYAAMSVRGMPAALDATVTMLPVPRPAIRRDTERDTWKTPLVLTAKVAAQSSSVSSATAEHRSTPATLTAMSRGPSVSSASVTSASTAAESVTSSVRAATCSPYFRASAVTPSGAISVARTRAPRSTRACTTASPIPRPAPVTRASRPVSSGAGLT